MFFGGKKKEKAKGIGGIFSLLGGILILAGFFMPLTAKIDISKLAQKGNLEALVSEGSESVTLFQMSQKNQTFFAFAVLGALAIFIGAYFYKLALLNIFVGAGVYYLFFVQKPFAYLSSLFISKPGLGTIAILLGALFTVIGGFWTFKKNVISEKSKKAKKKEEKAKKKKEKKKK
ncbi:MAG: hypothetical protein D6785_07400 [Planctomycetota bacterium]|nr:MAG: hypothetical protein D6785_07400 [Planctomycetota bacterium]